MTVDFNFSMSLAGIGLGFQSSNPEIIRKLEQRYACFQNTDSIDATITVLIDNKREVENLQDQEQYLGSTQYISRTRNTLGKMNLETTSGELILSRTVSIPEIEYFVRGVYAILSFKSGCLMLHSAGVVRDNKAYIFIGHSGSGKSTISQLSMNYDILNDDLILLRPEKERWLAYSTPFWNPGLRKDVNLQAKVHSLFSLAKDKDVFLQKVEKSIAIAELITNVPVIPINPDLMDQLIDLCSHLLDQVQMYRLHFRKDPSFWEAIQTNENR